MVFPYLSKKQTKLFFEYIILASAVLILFDAIPTNWYWWFFLQIVGITLATLPWSIILEIIFENTIFASVTDPQALQSSFLYQFLTFHLGIYINIYIFVKLFVKDGNTQLSKLDKSGSNIIH